MSTLERVKAAGQPDLHIFSDVQRPHIEQGVRLELGGDALFVGAMFVLSLTSNDTDGRQLCVTRDVRVPVSVVKRDGSIRSYGFFPSMEENPVFDQVPLGFRPSRPFIFINGGEYKLTFEKDDSTSLTFTLESQEEIIKRRIFGHIDHRKFLRDLALEGRLSLEAEREFLYAEDPATEEDIRARITYQIEKYLEYQRAGTLTPQWIAYGRKHAGEIARLVY